MTLSIPMFGYNAQYHYDECNILFAIMLNVVMLSVFMLNVIMLSVVMLSFVMLSVVMLSVIMLSVIMLSVIVPIPAPYWQKLVQQEKTYQKLKFQFYSQH
jgi:hypothetical protein